MPRHHMKAVFEAFAEEKPSRTGKKPHASWKEEAEYAAKFAAAVEKAVGAKSL